MKLPLKLKNIRHICAADWEVNTMQNKSMFQTLKDMPSSQKNIERLKQTWCNSEDTVVCIGLLIGAVIGFLVAGKLGFYLWAWELGDPQLEQGFFGCLINGLISLVCGALSIVIAGAVGGAVGGAGLYGLMATIRAIYVAIMTTAYVVSNKKLLTAELDKYVKERAEKLDRELSYLSMPLEMYREHNEFVKKYPHCFK